MIAYVTLGTNNLKKAVAFFDELYGLLGAKRVFESDRGVSWSNGGAAVSVIQPYDGKPATVGNGVMVSLAAPDRETVDKIYAKAIELGGTCEGKPGERMPGMYFAYFRDLDGNKFAVCKMG